MNKITVSKHSTQFNKRCRRAIRKLDRMWNKKETTGYRMRSILRQDAKVKRLLRSYYDQLDNNQSS